MSCPQKGASRASGAWPGSDDGTAGDKAEPAEAAGASRYNHVVPSRYKKREAVLIVASALFY